MPVWEMVKKAAEELDASERWVSPSEIIRVVRKNHSDENVNKGTIRSQIMYNSINHPSRLHSPSPLWKNNPILKYDNSGGYKLLSEREKELFKKALLLDKPLIGKKYYTIQELENSMSEREVEESIPVIEDEETEERVRASFSLEKDLHEFLKVDLDSLEEGLRLYEDGSEFTTEVGRIDLLAIDDNEDLVVIELKTGKAGDSAFGQIMRYIGYVEDNVAESGQNVRGIIVADDFDENLKYSIRKVPELELKKYRVNFDFEDKEFL